MPLEDGRHDPWPDREPWPVAYIETRRLACLAARRSAWVHLHRLGLLDENTDRLLRGAA